jgi:putative flippase GtrA
VDNAGEYMQMDYVSPSGRFVKPTAQRRGYSERVCERQVPMKKQHAQFLRFVVSGASNTLLSYAAFVALVSFVHYLVAYTIAYALGIVLSYVLNSRWVFRAAGSWRTILAFPLVYVLQYVCSAALLFVLVHEIGLRSEIAALIVVASSVLLTYALMRTLFRSAVA